VGTRDVSQRPAATRRRLRQKTDKLTDEILADIETVYQKPVAEWDWEELSKGCPRDPVDGGFPKGRPRWITPAITAEVQRRMREYTEHEIMTHAVLAMETLGDLLKNAEVDDFGKPIVSASVKLQAAQYIINQTIGTPKAKVEVSNGDQLTNFLADVLVNPDGEPSHGMVIEGSMVEEDDEDMGGE
jgi:hypothetical protein